MDFNKFCGGDTYLKIEVSNLKIKRKTDPQHCKTTLYTNN